MALHNMLGIPDGFTMSSEVKAAVFVLACHMSFFVTIPLRARLV